MDTKRWFQHRHRCWKWCPRASIQAWTPVILLANNFCRSAFGKSLGTYKSCWRWCSRASVQAWTRVTLFANTFCRSAFGKSLCTYKRCWKWCPRASIKTWTRLILFANTFCRSACGVFLTYPVTAVLNLDHNLKIRNRRQRTDMEIFICV
jgi:Pyruvate/2-oxoacid:ferredoxin oxidoreductase delta subunit